MAPLRLHADNLSLRHDTPKSHRYHVALQLDTPTLHLIHETSHDGARASSDA